MEWYYAEAGQRLGPISEGDLQSLHAAGRVRPDTLVWRSGMAQWQPFSSVQPGAFGVPATDGQFCTECGNRYGPSDLLSFGASRVCANCKDVFFQRVREQGTAVATDRGLVHYGGFWIRLAAILIDGLILGAFYVVLGVIFFLIFRESFVRTFSSFIHPELSSSAVGLFYGLMGIVYLVTFATTIAYESWFVAQRGGTPGKLALGLRVVRSDGTRLTPGRSVGRAFAYLLSHFVPFALGFIIAGFDSQKRALHDHICDTRVVYKTA